MFSSYLYEAALIYGLVFTSVGFVLGMFYNTARSSSWKTRCSASSAPCDTCSARSSHLPPRREASSARAAAQG